MQIKRYQSTRDGDKLMDLLRRDPECQPKLRKKTKREQYRNALRETETYVAYEKNELIGFVRAVEDYGLAVLVRELYVAPPHRGKGVSRMLMESLWEKFPHGTIQIAFTDASYAERGDFPKTSGVYFVPKPESVTTHLADDTKERRQKKAEARKKRRERRALEALDESDEFFYMIMGYTGGGAPNGVTWEEAYANGLLTDVEAHSRGLEDFMEEPAPESEPGIEYDLDDIPF